MGDTPYCSPYSPTIKPSATLLTNYACQGNFFLRIFGHSLCVRHVLGADGSCPARRKKTGGLGLLAKPVRSPQIPAVIIVLGQTET
jgi:hypothetical protein